MTIYANGQATYNLQYTQLKNTTNSKKVAQKKSTKSQNCVYKNATQYEWNVTTWRLGGAGDEKVVDKIVCLYLKWRKK